jgi:hypothetical protein
MKIWIPKCGDEVKLDQDWTFTLLPEWRNSDFCGVVSGKAKVGPRYQAKANYQEQQVTFPAGCQIVFDRIYIRQDSGDYTSVTFIIKEHPIFNYIGERFWVKLPDANKIEATHISENNPVGGFAKARYKAEAKSKVDPAFKQAAEDRKTAKEALEAARRACSEEVASNNAGPIAAHVDAIIREVVNHSASVRNYYANDARGVRNMMISGEMYRRNRSGNVWTIDSTKNDVAAGLTTRNIRFCLDGRKFGGFTVISRGTEIMGISLLV